MEHYRSVFATAAIMVIGLVATSPIMRAQDPAVQARAGAVVAGQAEDDTWSDPPRAKAQAVSADNVGATTMSVPRPASFTLLPPETAALLMAGDMQAKAGRAERGQALRQHRPLKVARRDRQEPAGGREPVAPQPQKAAQIDSIGDLVRACLGTAADCSKSTGARFKNASDGSDGGGTTADAS